ncbi:hypothetical protein Taro_015177 [Colocasia esculenta]|uniref:Uncharacterized protein n=1 Tax=Colocasia esculenta TaxID=4460 RepID=A0A843UP41_COLES|nr:hypothetical protein [Colocasia esculenta]
MAAVEMETFTFQAEIYHLLSLIINTIYSNKEIFLHKLISKSSNLTCSNPSISSCSSLLCFLFIHIVPDKATNTLSIIDSTIGMTRMKPPTVFMPVSIKENVEKLFEAHKAMDQFELKHNLITLNVGSFTCAGEEYELRKDLKVRAFRTYHAIPSQCEHKLKQKYASLKGDEIKNLKSSDSRSRLGIGLPNAFSLAEDIVGVVKEVCQKMTKPVPEFLVFLNVPMTSTPSSWGCQIIELDDT